MTSKRSAFMYVWPHAIFIGASVAFAESTFAMLWSVSIVGFLAYSEYRRRSTLRQREDGTYVWIEWHGGERCSIDDPSAEGGEWDSDGDGDGDGGD